ncbi:MAG: rod shape-determining protein RodA, partial [Magnetospirillum sp.]
MIPVGPRFSSPLNRTDMGWRDKIWQINWALIVLMTAVASIGFLTLYSAAGGNLDPWAWKQMVRFAGGLVMMIIVAMIDIRFWMRHAYGLYLLSLVLLVAVEIKGTIGMGAQRWIDLGFIQLQPSEIAKVALILTLARYFHGAAGTDVSRPPFLLAAIMIVLVPVALVLKQPDLGTAMMLLMSSGAIFFMAGVRLWMFGTLIGLGMAAVPVAWQFLHDYQKKRIIIFLNPDEEPLGAGYHITQSKIALGSGGIFVG